MFFRDLKPKDGVTLRVTLVEVHLPVRLGHRDAAKTFVAPLTRQLAAAGLGTVTAFNVREKSDDEVCGLDIYLGMTNASRSSLETVAGMLEFLQAPCGSSIRVTDTPGDPLVFGITEGLEVSIGNQSAPDGDARRDLALTCRDAVKQEAVSRGWARRADRTLFYFYGESFTEMHKRLDSALEDHPRFSAAVLRRMA